MTGRGSFNVCWVVADDLGCGDLSCYGATALQTPNLDALAAAGVRYTRAHATSSVCTPSRYSIITGRYPWRSPLGAGVLGGLDPSIVAGAPTVASLLKGHGYRTVAVGKWHLGLDWSLTDGSRRTISPETPLVRDLDGAGWDVDYAEPYENGPLDLGFDTFFGIAGSLDMPPYVYLEDARAQVVPTEAKYPLIASQRPGPAAPGWVDETVDPTFAERAITEIRRSAEAQHSGAGEPLFLYLAFAAPHRPCVTPERWRDVSGLGVRGDAISMLDDLIGGVVAAFHDSPLPTLVVFTSDNGAPTQFVEDGDPALHSPNGTLRGQKADVYEGGHRVPLILAMLHVDQRRPVAGFEPGSSISAPVSLVDLTATVHALLTGEHNAGDGRPLAEVLPNARVIGSQSFDGSLVLIQGELKAAFTSGSGGFSDPAGEPCRPTDPSGQFFDLSNDPQEEVNLWPDRTEFARVMAEEFTDQVGYDWTFYPPARPNEADFHSGRDQEAMR